MTWSAGQFRDYLSGIKAMGAKWDGFDEAMILLDQDDIDGFTKMFHKVHSPIVVNLLASPGDAPLYIGLRGDEWTKLTALWLMQNT